MQSARVKKAVASLLAAELMTEWEVDEYTELVVQLPPQARDAVLRLIPAIHPVSHALCRSFLAQAATALQCLTLTQLPGWVNMVLEIYEAEGLGAAHRFLSDVKNNYVCRIKGEAGVEFAEAAKRLRPYVRGLAGRELELAVAPAVSTDTRTIFLPPRLVLFRDYEHNFLTYKLIVSQQWASIALESYFPQLTIDSSRSAGKNCRALAQFLADSPSSRPQLTSTTWPRRCASAPFSAASCPVCGAMRRQCAAICWVSGPLLRPWRARCTSSKRSSNGCSAAR